MKRTSVVKGDVLAPYPVPLGETKVWGQIYPNVEAPVYDGPGLW